jgi:hypothetical protein
MTFLCVIASSSVHCDRCPHCACIGQDKHLSHHSLSRRTRCTCKSAGLLVSRLQKVESRLSRFFLIFFDFLRWRLAFASCLFCLDSGVQQQQQQQQ